MRKKCIRCGKNRLHKFFYVKENIRSMTTIDKNGHSKKRLASTVIGTGVNGKYGKLSADCSKCRCSEYKRVSHVKQTTCNECEIRLVVNKNWSRCNQKHSLYICQPCMNYRSWRSRTMNKVRGIEYLGGKCSHCHGVFHWSMYDFHHPNPKDKLDGRNTRSALGGRAGNKWESVREELDRCVLLCSNCHRYEHTPYKDRELDVVYLSASEAPTHRYQKPVRDINTGKIFKNQQDAADYYGVSQGTVRHWAMGRCVSKQGIQVEYV